MDNLAACGCTFVEGAEDSLSDTYSGLICLLRARVFNSKDHEEKSKWSEESAEFVIVE